jgi:hypothetical protein
MTVTPTEESGNTVSLALAPSDEGGNTVTGGNAEVKTTHDSSSMKQVN